MRLVPLLLLCACATSGTYQTADTLGKGGWEAGGDLSAGMIVGGGTSDRPVLPLPRVVARGGVADRVDLGGSFGIDGLRFGPKFQLTPVQTGPVIVSFAPGARVLPLPRPSDGGFGLLAGLEETVLIGVPFSDRTQLVFNLRSTQDVGMVENTAFLLWAGGSVGLSVRAGDQLRLMPEIGAMSPLLVLDEGDSTGASGAILQAGLGVVVGRRD